MVYLLHFADTPLHHAGHYLGFCQSAAHLGPRLDHHAKGTGGRLLNVLRLKGIGWYLVRTWEDGDRALERRLKDQGHLPRHCPLCRGKRRKRRAVSG